MKNFLRYGLSLSVILLGGSGVLLMIRSAWYSIFSPFCDNPDLPLLCKEYGHKAITIWTYVDATFSGSLILIMIAAISAIIFMIFDGTES